MTIVELRLLIDPVIRSVIAAHRNDDPGAFAMKYHARTDLPVREIAEQIGCIRKADKKLPSLSQFPLIYTRLALEQASGERAAAYKASLMSGRRIIDLTGGLGIDSIFLSDSFESVVYCERDPVLAELFSWNLKTLGIGNVEIRTGDSRDILETYQDDWFDWIFVDPARREHGGRSVGLETTSPDVVRFHDIMLKKAPKVCIKASPALEISSASRQLPALATVTVVSVKRECKEILLMLDRNRAPGLPLTIRAVCLDEKDFMLEASAGERYPRTVADVPCRYLYEPDPAIIKAKLTARLAADFRFSFINASVDYLTSDRYLDTFPGRFFHVIDTVKFKPKKFQAFLESHAISEAGIQRRDFPLAPEEIRKRYGLKESSENFLFFTRNNAGELIAVYCKKSKRK
jgi:hypothetical protein